ncbi:MAG: hypothetical protein ACKVS6_10640 [Planctomycetota bacterium]
MNREQTLTKLKNALGERVFTNFVEAKRREWQENIAQVHPCELDRYLNIY